MTTSFGGAIRSPAGLSQIVGIMFSILGMTICSMGITMYNMAETFEDQDAACQAKDAMISLTVFLVVFLMFLMYYSYTLGVKSPYFQNLSSLRKTVYQRATMELSGMVLGMIMCLFFFMVSFYVCHTLIYENIATWRDPKEVCAGASDKKDPAEIAEGMDTAIMVLGGLVGSIVFLLYLGMFIYAKQSRGALYLKT